MELALNHDELMFSPRLADFQHALETAIDQAIKKVMSMRKLIKDPEFAHFTQVYFLKFF